MKTSDATPLSPTNPDAWADVPYRWYFAVYTATGTRVGQLYVVAMTSDDATARAEKRLARGELLGVPVRYLPAGLV